MNYSNQTVSAAQNFHAGSIAPAPAERGQLECAADAIAGSTSDLAVALDALESRLAPVLQPSVPSPTSAPAPAPAIPISPAVSYLVEQRRRSDALVQRIHEIRSRLDT